MATVFIAIRTKHRNNKETKETTNKAQRNGNNAAQSQHSKPQHNTTTKETSLQSVHAREQMIVSGMCSSV
jgi:hypothetical protein